MAVALQRPSGALNRVPRELNRWLAVLNRIPRLLNRLPPILNRHEEEKRWLSHQPSRPLSLQLSPHLHWPTLR